MLATTCTFPRKSTHSVGSTHDLQCCDGIHGGDCQQKGHPRGMLLDHTYAASPFPTAKPAEENISSAGTQASSAGRCAKDVFYRAEILGKGLAGLQPEQLWDSSASSSAMLCSVHSAACGGVHASSRGIQPHPRVQTNNCPFSSVRQSSWLASRHGIQSHPRFQTNNGRKTRNMPLRLFRSVAAGDVSKHCECTIPRIRFPQHQYGWQALADRWYPLSAKPRVCQGCSMR
jgi:hypothetical protein